MKFFQVTNKLFFSLFYFYLFLTLNCTGGKKKDLATGISFGEHDVIQMPGFLSLYLNLLFDI